MLVLLAAFALVPLLLPWLVAPHRSARLLRRGAAADSRVRRTRSCRRPPCSSGDTPFESFDWIPPARHRALDAAWTPSAWVMTLIVTGVGALVMLYCRWYFRGKTEGLGQFSAVLLAFAGAMYGLVLTDDLVVLVMFWEVTSILSYLLIGYYHRRGREPSRRAAGAAGHHPRRSRDADRRRAAGRRHRHVEHLAASSPIAPTGPVVDAALVLLLVGALSKSAIFPFHFWLPGAMAAPTPVSAYLHAAAMVKAGIYLIARFAPGLRRSPRPGGRSSSRSASSRCCSAAFQALRETDLKRILAFGTVSQLGLLTVVLGYGTQRRRARRARPAAQPRAVQVRACSWSSA